jgi:isopentenyl phosphate kinase
MKKPLRVLVAVDGSKGVRQSVLELRAVTTSASRRALSQLFNWAVARLVLVHGSGSNGVPVQVGASGSILA